MFSKGRKKVWEDVWKEGRLERSLEGRTFRKKYGRKDSWLFRKVSELVRERERERETVRECTMRAHSRAVSLALSPSRTSSFHLVRVVKFTISLNNNFVYVIVHTRAQRQNA